MSITQWKIEIEDQQAEAQELLASANLVARRQMELFQELLGSHLIKVIMGVRRSGKSTLAIQSMVNKNFVYFNFDSEILAKIKSEELGKIFEIGLGLVPKAQFFIFDEIQNIENWELFINKLHRKKKNILLTGSNSRLLSSELTTHLTGRVLSLELLPFSFEEYLGRATEPRLKKIEETVQLKSLFLNYLEIGGFPDLKEMPKGSRLASHYLTELYDRIVSRDLVQRRKIRNIKALKELALSLLSNYSGRFTYQSLKRLTSINSINTVKNYVDFIQESYLGFVVEPFSFKIKERISLPKKFYTIDVALAEAIIKSTRFDLGKKLENIIYLELRRRGLEIYYIYHAGYEVDFAIRSGKKLTELIQVTWDLSDPNTRKREINSLIKAAKDFKVESLTIIIHEGEEEVITSDEGFKITVLIAWKWLLTSG